ncbi:MAG: type IV pilus modification protein PilV [Halioglobus sp.]|nr:type IV pilus modification protein PilV [Halioglobus sp.]
MSIVVVRRGGRQAGFGLVEVAVALLVFSLGAVALAGLQISARRAGYEALQRTEAALLAVDMLERIRGNRARLADYASSGVGAASGSALPVPASDCRHLPCTPGQLRAQDLWEWEQALDGAAATRGGSGLVNALGCLRVSGRLVTVEIVWEGFRAQQPPPTGSCGSGRYGAAAERRQSLQMTSFIAAGEAG